MKRYAQDKPKTERRWKAHRRYLSVPCTHQPGRFHKRKPLDCGKPRCVMCHGDKLSEGKGGPAHKRYLADRGYHEQLHELDD
jgi:hypothetical protein